MIKVIEKEVLRLANCGDEDSAEEVCAYAIALLEDFVKSHIRSIADADDIIQEIMVVLADKLDGGLVTSLDAFVIQTARQLIKRHQNGEYLAGKRRQLQPPAYSQREIPFSQAFGLGVTVEDLESMFDEEKFI